MEVISWLLLNCFDDIVISVEILLGLSFFQYNFIIYFSLTLSIWNTWEVSLWGLDISWMSIEISDWDVECLRLMNLIPAKGFVVTLI